MNKIFIILNERIQDMKQLIRFNRLYSKEAKVNIQLNNKDSIV